MGKRLDLQSILESITRNVYFQPPTNIQMSYPCIVYRRSNAKTSFAGNKPYTNDKRYQIMVIDKDPDSLILDKIALLPTCVFERHYTAENLNHDIYNLYY